MASDIKGQWQEVKKRGQWQEIKRDSVKLYKETVARGKRGQWQVI